ncbi:MAG: hypothetical protein QW334_03870, partial [Thermofilum sp.]
MPYAPLSLELRYPSTAAHAVASLFVSTIKNGLLWVTVSDSVSFDNPEIQQCRRELNELEIVTCYLHRLCSEDAVIETMARRSLTALRVLNDTTNIFVGSAFS